MVLEFLLLGMLRSPASGYDLRASFLEGPRHFWSAELSQIYPALGRMQRRRWLRSKRERSARGPARRVYTRTAKGLAALRAWLREEPEVGTERLSYIGQLIFLGELHDAERTRAFLRRLREHQLEHLQLLESAASYLGAPRGLEEHQLHELLCLRIGIRSAQGRIAACDEGLRLLRDRGTRARRRTKSHG